MKLTIQILSAAALFGLVASEATAQHFQGPRIGLEIAHEDYGAVAGESVAIVAGWDAEVAASWVVGADVRLTVDGVEERRSSAVGVNTQTVTTAIEDQWGVSARVGRVIGGRVLLFGQLGYEQFHYDAVRDLRAPVCAPPTSCLISRLAQAFDEESMTYGVGAEWAVTDHWRVRGTYTRSDGSAVESDRLAVTGSFQF
jgi:opacity protein-like surface antigen